MTQSRTTISTLMIVVLVMAILLAIYRNLGHAYLFAFLAPLVAILSPYFIWPWRLRQTSWIAVDSTLEPIDPRGPDVPSEVSETTASAVEGLARLGFSIKYAYRTRDSVHKGTGYAVLFENESGDLARLILVEVYRSSRVVSSLLMYTAEFEDGTQVHTTDNNAPRIHPLPRPPVHSFTFPRVGGAGRLYAIHRRLVDRYGGEGPRVDPLRGGLMAYFRRTKESNEERQIASGYYSLDEAHRVLRPTWKGATLMAWKLLWPLKSMIRDRSLQRAERLISTLDLDRPEG
jgi:hypothetical protein